MLMASATAAADTMDVVGETVCEFFTRIDVPEAEQENLLLVFLGMLMKKGLTIAPARQQAAPVTVPATTTGSPNIAQKWKLVSEEDKAYWKAVAQAVDPTPGKARPTHYGAFTVFKGNKDTVTSLTREDGTIARPRQG